jgi:hypothetical protein
MHNPQETMALVKKITENFDNYDLKTVVTALATCLGFCLCEIETDEERQAARRYMITIMDHVREQSVEAKGLWAKFFSRLMAA